MFLRFHEAKERREGGFTLIELLVVILIIAILAAIAIPVFLNQRKKGWNSQVESLLKNAATTQESWSTGHEGSYTTSVDDLKTEGLTFSADAVKVDSITLTGGGTGYCIQASSLKDTSIIKHYDSDVGAPKDGAC
jgi:type IV pilus assembly protein PilA